MPNTILDKLIYTPRQSLICSISNNRLFACVSKVLIFLLVAVSSIGYAQTITYEVSQISSTEYEYRYTLTNDSAADIAEFIIFFDETLYDNVTETSRPSGWDSLIIPPDPVLGPGEYNAFVTGSALAVGDSIGEFVLRFEWLGTGEPGAQPFSIIDPVTFTSIFNGTTQPVLTPSGTPASIPSITLLGLLSLLVGIFAMSYRRLGRK